MRNNSIYNMYMNETLHLITGVNELLSYYTYILFYTYYKTSGIFHTFVYLHFMEEYYNYTKEYLIHTIEKSLHL